MRESVLALISGGIDSSSAAYLIGRLGFNVIPLYFDNYPFSGESNKKRMLDCVKTLKKHVEIDRVFLIPHGNNLLEISKNCRRKYTCVICRRMMFRVAERLCERFGADAIVTGEFLGSKASQTLKNMKVISQVVKIPILRPILGMDKEEIERVGREIGTYSSSIIPAGCCAIVPKKPSTEAKLNVILEEEKKIDVERLVGESINSMKVISIGELNRYGRNIRARMERIEKKRETTETSG